MFFITSFVVLEGVGCGCAQLDYGVASMDWKPWASCYCVLTCWLLEETDEVSTLEREFDGLFECRTAPEICC